MLSKNKPSRRYLSGITATWQKMAVILVLLLIGLFFLMEEVPSIKEASKSIVSAKEMEAENVQFMDYDDNGNLLVSALIRKVWATRDQSVLYGRELEDGHVYSNGDAFLSRLKANVIQIDTARETLAASGEINATLHPPQKTMSLSSPTRRFKLSADRMTYLGKQNQAILEGNILIYDQTTSIRPSGRMEVDLDKKQLSTIFPVNIRYKETEITAGKMVFDMATDTMELFKPVRIHVPPSPVSQNHTLSREDRIRSEPIDISADYVKAQGEEFNVISFRGNVVFTQPDKQLKGRSSSYDKTLRHFVVTGNVSVSAGSLQWLADKPVAEYKNPDIRTGISLPVTASSEILEYDGANERLRMKKNVTVIQPDKVVHTQMLTLDGDKNVIYLSNGVRMKRTDDIFIADSAIVDLTKEEVTAEGIKESEFLIQ